MDVLPIYSHEIYLKAAYISHEHIQSGLVLQFTVAYFGKHQRNNSIDLSSCKKTACKCSLVYCFTRSTFQKIIGKKMSPVGTHKAIARVFSSN